MCDTLTGQVLKDLSVTRLSAKSINTTTLDACIFNAQEGLIEELTSDDATITNHLTVRNMTIEDGCTGCEKQEHTWRNVPDTSDPTVPTVQLNPLGANYVVPSTLLFPTSTQLGAGKRLAFNATDGSLRVGQVTGSQWNSRGINSVAFGLDNNVAGDNATIAGGERNSINAKSTGSGILAGMNNSIDTSATSAIGGGRNNRVTNSNDSLIGAGSDNTITDSSWLCGIVAGIANRIDLTSTTSAIGAGNTNGIYNTDSSFIGSGQTNKIYNSQSSAIGSGETNIIGNYDVGATNGSICSSVLGGATNIIGTKNGSGTNSYCAITGGQNNTIHQNVTHSSILGGYNNTIHETAHFSSILGGQGNTINKTASNALASGQGATVGHSNAMVFSCDPLGAASTASNQVIFALPVGGQFILTKIPIADPGVSGALYSKGVGGVVYISP